jgi:hypothetical protein
MSNTFEPVLESRKMLEGVGYLNREELLFFD